MIGAPLRARGTLAACAAMLLAGTAAADPDCRCRAPGGAMRDIGTVECFDIGARRVSVRCEMSTNTPYWRPMDGADDDCPAPA